MGPWETSQSIANSHSSYSTHAGCHHGFFGKTWRFGLVSHGLYRMRERGPCHPGHIAPSAESGTEDFIIWIPVGVTTNRTTRVSPRVSSRITTGVTSRVPTRLTPPCSRTSGSDWVATCCRVLVGVPLIWIATSSWVLIRIPATCSRVLVRITSLVSTSSAWVLVWTATSRWILIWIIPSPWVLGVSTCRVLIWITSRIGSTRILVRTATSRITGWILSWISSWVGMARSWIGVASARRIWIVVPIGLRTGWFGLCLTTYGTSFPATATSTSFSPCCFNVQQKHNK